jgi:hypothetical protein
MKRKLDSSNEQDAAGKRLKLTGDSASNTAPEPQATTSDPLEPEITSNPNKGTKSKGEKHNDRSKPHDKGKGHQRRKRVPSRPFPMVPTSVSDTGPRSNHKEGKNLICITRKTSLGCYLRRCKDVIIKDG